MKPVETDLSQHQQEACVREGRHGVTIPVCRLHRVMQYRAVSVTITVCRLHRVMQHRAVSMQGQAHLADALAGGAAQTALVLPGPCRCSRQQCLATR